MINPLFSPTRFKTGSSTRRLAEVLNSLRERPFQDLNDLSSRLEGTSLQKLLIPTEELDKYPSVFFHPAGKSLGMVRGLTNMERGILRVELESDVRFLATDGETNIFWRASYTDMRGGLYLHYSCRIGKKELERSSHLINPSLTLMLLSKKMPGGTLYDINAVEEFFAHIHPSRTCANARTHIPAWQGVSGCVGQKSALGVPMPQGKDLRSILIMLGDYLHKNKLLPGMGDEHGTRVNWKEVPNLSQVLAALEQPDWHRL